MRVDRFVCVALVAALLPAAALADDPNDPAMRSADARARDHAMIQKLNQDELAMVRTMTERIQVKLADIDPDFHSTHEDEAAAKGEIVTNQEKLRALQYRMYAENHRSLLICLQAMDAGGKDGTIQHVMGAMNPQGCQVQAFKTPSVEEAAHDFLWRVHKAVGGKGTVTVFNRSHYEDVLVVRVHKLVPKDVWSRRYDHINDFEKELTDNGTHILKFFLHISKEEQLFRFKERLNDPTKQWKISESDYLEREF